MSISSALQTGVSGLQANSRAVGGISENIANANTVGYKRGFSEMVTTTASGGGQTGVLSVEAVHRMAIDQAGGLISTNKPNDLAIAGKGFFVVTPNPNEKVATNFMLTRAGAFVPDANGDFKNAAGFFLSGYRYDRNGSIGKVDRSSFSQMQTVNIKNTDLSAAATTSIKVTGNLPAQGTGQATPGAPFTTSSEYYTPLGASERMSFSWQPTTVKNQWDLTVSDQNDNAYGSVTATFNDVGANAGTPASYSAVVNSATAPAGFSFDTATGVATVTIDNGTTPQALNITVGAPGSHTGVTQFAGDFSQNFERDGSSVGALSRTEIDENGVLYGIFDNGQRKPLFEIPVAVVANTGGLNAQKGNAYALTGESGGFFAHKAKTDNAGAINSGALEGSNVDIAEEMTDLIRRQRAYSTNAKIITTVDQMLDETTRLKR